MAVEPIRLTVEFNAAGQAQIRNVEQTLQNLSRQVALVNTRTGAAQQRAIRALQADANRYATFLQSRLIQTVNRVDRAFTAFNRTLFRVGRVGFFVAAAGAAAFTAAMVKLSESFFKINEQFRGLEITLRSAFRSFSIARQLRDELVKITAVSPLPFKDIAEFTRAAAVNPFQRSRIASQVSSGTLGQDSGFLRSSIRLVEQILTFRPDKAVEDVVFAIREAFGGEFRSLVRRFDIPLSIISAQSGVAVQDLKSDPAAVDRALKTFFGQLITPTAIRELLRQPSILIKNIAEQLVEIPLLRIGDTGLFDKVVDFFDDIFLRAQDFVANELDALAERIGDSASRLFDVLDQVGSGVFNRVLRTIGLGRDQNTQLSAIGRVGEGVSRALDYVAERLPDFLKKTQEFLDAIIKILTPLVAFFTGAVKFAATSPLATALTALFAVTLPRILLSAISAAAGNISGAFTSRVAQGIARPAPPPGANVLRGNDATGLFGRSAIVVSNRGPGGAFARGTTTIQGGSRFTAGAAGVGAGVLAAGATVGTAAIVTAIVSAIGFGFTKVAQAWRESRNSRLAKEAEAFQEELKRQFPQSPEGVTQSLRIQQALRGVGRDIGFVGRAGAVFSVEQPDLKTVTEKFIPGTRFGIPAERFSTRPDIQRTDFGETGAEIAESIFQARSEIDRLLGLLVGEGTPFTSKIFKDATFNPNVTRNKAQQERQLRAIGSLAAVVERLEKTGEFILQERGIDLNQSLFDPDRQKALTDFARSIELFSTDTSAAEAGFKKSLAPLRDLVGPFLDVPVNALTKSLQEFEDDALELLDPFARAKTSLRTTENDLQESFRAMIAFTEVVAGLNTKGERRLFSENLTDRISILRKNPEFLKSTISVAGEEITGQQALERLTELQQKVDFGQLEFEEVQRLREALITGSKQLQSIMIQGVIKAFAVDFTPALANLTGGARTSNLVSKFAELVREFGPEGLNLTGAVSQRRLGGTSQELERIRALSVQQDNIRIARRFALGTDTAAGNEVAKLLDPLALQLQDESADRRFALFGGAGRFDSFKNGFLSAVDELKVASRNFADFGQSVATTISTSFGNAFASIVTGAESAGEAFRNFGLNVVTSLANIASQKLAAQIFGSLFGALPIGPSASGFGQVSAGGLAQGRAILGRASGGAVYGPGGVDNVPIRATAGEFVVSRRGVKAAGLPFLQSINSGGVRRFQSGGLVGGGGGSVNINVAIDNSGETSREQSVNTNRSAQLLTRELEAAVVSVLQKHSRNGGALKTMARRV